MLALALVLSCTAATAADQQTVDYQKQYEEYQKQLKVYNEQMEEYKKQLRENQKAPLDNDATYVLPGQYSPVRQATKPVVTQQYVPAQQYYQQYDYNDQRQKPANAQPAGAMPNYYY